MRDKPIIFSAPMVRALHDGRKTQTRRVMKPQPTGVKAAVLNGSRAWAITPESNRCSVDWSPPSYVPGDRLWVREAFQTGWPVDDNDKIDQFDAHGSEKPRTIWYRATSDIGRWVDEYGVNRDVPWRPSIHMPRWASRLTLIVTDVRVQRLQDISEEDAIAEGAAQRPDGEFHLVDLQRGLTGSFATGREWFAALWDSLHGPGAWDENPWVSAVTFTAHPRNIDAMEPGHA